MSVAAIHHFLDLVDLPPRELSGIIEASRATKKRARPRRKTARWPHAGDGLRQAVDA